jgi:N-acyl amino acid synthase of PEP-CTERM/exosortase system
MPSPLLDLHRRLFETQIARSAAQIRVAQRLRYLAYVEQKGYLDPALYPEQRESDDDDARSAHALLISRANRRPLGSVRLILPPQPFPVERLIVPGALEGVPGFARAHAAEISRLCLLQDLPAVLDLGDEEKRRWASEGELRHTLQLAVAGVLRGVVALTRAHHVRFWCAMMGRPVLRRLARLGVRFRPLGAPIRHFGLKQPVTAAVDELLDAMRKERPDVWELVTHPI